jgi:hypothetical protein
MSSSRRASFSGAVEERPTVRSWSQAEVYCALISSVTMR